MAALVTRGENVSLVLKGFHALNTLRNRRGATLSETGTLSEETPNPDFLFKCRRLAGKETVGG